MVPATVSLTFEARCSRPPTRQIPESPQVHHSKRLNPAQVAWVVGSVGVEQLDWHTDAVIVGVE